MKTTLGNPDARDLVHKTFEPTLKVGAIPHRAMFIHLRVMKLSAPTKPTYARASISTWEKADHLLHSGMLSLLALARRFSSNSIMLYQNLHGVGKQAYLLGLVTLDIVVRH